MKTYYVVFLNDDHDKCEMVRKVKSELDIIAFGRHVEQKTDTMNFKIINDNGNGCPIYLGFQYLYKFVHTVDLKDIKEELERLQNEVYEVNKMVTDYIQEDTAKDEK